MAITLKTNWVARDIVKPIHMNEIGEAVNGKLDLTGGTIQGTGNTLFNVITADGSPMFQVSSSATRGTVMIDGKTDCRGSMELTGGVQAAGAVYGLRFMVSGSTTPSFNAECITKAYLESVAVLTRVTNTVSGTINFTGAIPTSTGVNYNNEAQLTTKRYVDNLVASSVPTNMVTLDTVQTITAAKTFNVNPLCTVDPTTNNHLVRKGYADDTYLNRTGGTQTIHGYKTFALVPQVNADPEGDNYLARKAYVDARYNAAISAIPTNYVTTNTEQTISANKTLTGTYTVGRTSDNGTAFLIQHATGASVGPNIQFLYSTSGETGFNIYSTGTNGIRVVTRSGTTMLQPSNIVNVDIGTDTGRFRNGYFGTMYYNSLGGTSDKRYKKDINRLSTEIAWNIITNSPSVSYLYDKERVPTDDQRVNFGFVAQDVEALLGKEFVEKYKLISKSDDRYTIDYTQYVPILTSVVQDLRRELDEIKQLIKGGNN